MPRLRLLLALLLACLIGACAQRAGRPAPRPGGGIVVQLERDLRLPPTADALAVLRALGRSAGQDSCAASWSKAHYLIDLFDWVRLAPETMPTTNGRLLLWQALDLAGAPGRGQTATRQVLAGLARQLQQVAPSCPQRAWAQQARELLAADQAPRRTHEQALATAVVYKQLARSSAPLAPNARLRLWSWCAAAFQLAAGGDPAGQHPRLLQCLYPLFDADPAPYFSSDAALRPPDPPWPLLAHKLPDLLAPLRASRLAALATALAAEQRRFLALAQAKLPTPLNLSRLSLPRARGATPWDRTPVLLVTRQGFIVGGRALLADDLEALDLALRDRLHNDPRGRVTMVAPGELPAERLLELGRVARLAGAATLALGVSRQVAAQTVPGDVQQQVFGQGPVWRLEELPLSLQLLAPAGRANVQRERPLGLSYDQRTAEHRLAIHLSPAGCRLSSVHGSIASLPCSQLVDPLLGTRLLYPDDVSLILIPEQGALLKQLIRLADQLQSPQSRVRFTGLALGSPGLLAPPERDLAELVAISRQAEVHLDDAAKVSWLPLLRRCYLKTLRESWSSDSPLPQGTLRLRATRRGLKIQPGSLRLRSLQDCLERSLPPPAAPGTFIANFGLNGVR